jgi:hypothetical protein
VREKIQLPMLSKHLISYTNNKIHIIEAVVAEKKYPQHNANAHPRKKKLLSHFGLDEKSLSFSLAAVACHFFFFFRIENNMKCYENKVKMRKNANLLSDY